MIRTQIYLPDDLYRDLKLLSNTRQTNISKLIREGAREVVRKKTKIKKGAWESFMGAIKTKVKTNAVKDIHDYYKKYAI